MTRKKPEWPPMPTDHNFFAGIDFAASGAARKVHQQVARDDLNEAADRLAAARVRLREALGARVLAQKTASDALNAARADRRARTKSRRNLALGG